MIRLHLPEPPAPPLTALERFGLELLLDLSRVLEAPADWPTEVVPLRITDQPTHDGVADLREPDELVTASGGAVSIGRAALALVARVAGAVAEQESGATDRYGRVPPQANELVQMRLEREPVVQVAATALRRKVAAVADRRPVVLVAPWPEGRRWALAVTHDLDVVAAWPAFTVLRLAELLRRIEIPRAARVVGSAVRNLFRAPVFDAAREVLSITSDLGIRTTWFIITGKPTAATIRAGDITYDVDAPATRRILEAVTAAGGHEFGVHGSFATFDAPELLRSQREQLRAITGQEIDGVRQHFLRLRPGRTHREMEAAGYSFDSTVGFSDRNGFRLGVADCIPVWDAAAGATLGIDTIPIAWMDRALSKYRRVEDPRAWVDDAVDLSIPVREVEGVWCGIWHPNLAPALGFPDAPMAFRRLCERMLSHRPWAAPAGEIARWRRARRQVRIAAGSAPDAIRLTIPEPHPAIALENPRGESIPFAAT